MVSNTKDNPANQPFLPKVSVVIPIYNGEKDLPDLIGCLYAQTYPRDHVEYLLIDNRSRDRTAAIIQTTAKEAQSQGMTFRYLQENRIQSPSAARNTGIRACTTKIIAFTDVDCRPQPDWLYTLIQPFADPKVGIVGGAILALPGKTLLENYAKRQGTLSHKFGHAYKPPFGPSANLAFRRQTFEQVGLFRPYVVNAEDIDICWRIMKTGAWKFYSAEQAVIRHRHRKTLGKFLSFWRGVGHAFQNTYELHGIELFETPSGFLKGWKQWISKELPEKNRKMMKGKATLLDLLERPIFLLAKYAEAIGRRETKVSEQMRQIEWL